MENSNPINATLVFKTVPNGIKAEQVKCKHLPIIPVEEGMFQLHTLGAFVGERGSGKTNACVLLMQKYLKDKSITRIFIISPTYDANPPMHTLGVKPEDIYKDKVNGQGAVDDIVAKVEKEAIKWEKHKEYNAAHRRWREHRYTFEDQLLLAKYNFQKFGEPKRPVCVLLIDDMSMTSIYSASESNPLSNLCLRHRHIFGVGISIFFMVQNFKMGIPKFIRDNVQQFFLWQTNNMETLLGIFGSFGNLCAEDQFLEIYAVATHDAHHFLTIDGKNPVIEHRFRKDFDTYLEIPNFRQNENVLRLIADYRRKKRKREREDPEFALDPIHITSEQEESK